MTFTLDFPDSEVRDIVAADGVVRVRFAAAAARDAAGALGWLPTVQATLADAMLSGDAAHAFGKLADGTLHHDGRAVALVSVPATLSGDLKLVLRFSNGTLLVVRGRTLRLSVDADARFADNLSC